MRNILDSDIYKESGEFDSFHFPVVEMERGRVPYPIGCLPEDKKYIELTYGIVILDWISVKEIRTMINAGVKLERVGLSFILPIAPSDSEDEKCQQKI